MCLAVPGKIVSLAPDGADLPLGTVDFQGNRVEVSFALVPEATVDDWVLVHAGFAITLLDEAEARETWYYLKEAGLVDSFPENDS